MTSWIGWITTAALTAAVAGGTGVPGVPAGVSGVAGGGFCAPDDPGADYYAFELVATGSVPGTGRSTGSASVAFARSPFGIAVATDGSYLYDLRVTTDRLTPAVAGEYTVWVTTPSLDRIERQGVLEPGETFEGRVGWNKFLVVVTLEPEGADEGAEIWTGPVVLRGMSRSGMMHTMAGHGPFQQENCATYGYD